MFTAFLLGALAIAYIVLKTLNTKARFEEADARSRELPVLKDVLALFEKLDADGGAKLGTQALIKEYE